MHGNPRLTEARIDRFVAERVAPAVYRERVALELSACTAARRTGALPRGRRPGLSSRSLPAWRGARRGAPPGSARPVTCHRVASPDGESGRPDRDRARDRPRLRRRQAGVPGRGARLASRREHDQGRLAVQPGGAVARRRPGRRLRRGRRKPEHRRRLPVLSHAVRRPGDGGHRTPVRLQPHRRRPARRRRLGAAAGPDGADRADEGAASGLDPARAASGAGSTGLLDEVDPADVAASAAGRSHGAASSPRQPASARARTTSCAVGHAHIDSAWLWPMRETVRKCARTFSNVLALMDADPDFVFACSSAQQYAWMKEFYPELFERIREKVAAGRFVPVGGMWVESDTNMPGGEAMARQLVAGKRFFLEEFGVETQDVWLPDSFGYSGALPADRPGGRARAGSSRRSSRGTTPTACRTTRSPGRGSTARACSPTSRPSTPTTPTCPRPSCCTPSANFAEKGVAGLVDRAVRLGRRRRRPDPRDGRVRAAVRVARGRADRRAGQPAHVLRARRGRVHPAAGVVRRDVPRVPPRHLHLAGAHQAGQPPQRAPAARGRAVGGDRGRADRRRVPVRRARARSGRPRCCTSSTTSCPAARSAGCTGRRRRPTRASAPSSRP